MNLASTGFAGGYPDIPETHDYSATIHRILNRDAQFLFKAMADGSFRTQEQPLRFISIFINTILLWQTDCSPAMNITCGSSSPAAKKAWKKPSAFCWIA